MLLDSSFLSSAPLVFWCLDREREERDEGGKVQLSQGSSYVMDDQRREMKKGLLRTMY